MLDKRVAWKIFIALYIPNSVVFPYFTEKVDE